MCGRYASTKDPAALAAEFDAVDATAGDAPGPDHNVAPTKPVLAVVTRHPRDADGQPDPASTVRSLRVMRWGLVPYWAKDPSVASRMINARVEGVATKPAFRTPLARRRCLLPADGWYEWQRDGGAKQPYFLTRRDGAPLALAGLWDTWRAAGADGPPLVTCAVLTTAAVGPLREIHERMPLVLPRASWAAWLDPDSTGVAGLLAPPPNELVDALELRPVSRQVNDVRHNGPELTVAAQLAATQPAPVPLTLDLG